MINPKIEVSTDGTITIYFNMVSEGGALIEWSPIEREWNLYSIPVGGGEESFVNSGLDFGTLIEEANTWT